MDLKIITIFFLLANGEVEHKEYKINEPCIDWYMKQLVHVDKPNIHFIEGMQTIGFHCGKIKKE